ncbi:MAG: sulfite reductase subunit alpha [Solimonas sp.]
MKAQRTGPDLSVYLQGLLLLVLAALAALAFALQATPPVWDWPARARVLCAVAAVLAYTVACLAASWRRRRVTASLAVGDAADFLIIHASQTGFAEQLAQQTAQALRGAGRAVTVLPLGELDAARLRTGDALFLVSTTGEGDAPDSAFRFVRQSLAAPAALQGLRYGVLALGDRSYARFCAFGHRLEHWLRLSGARPLFDLVEVDNGEPGALRHWQHHLRQLVGHAEIADWRAPAYERWQLVERVCLNPGGVGAPAFRIALRSLGGAASWQGGDIAEIGPCNGADEVGQLLAALGIDGGIAVAAGEGQGDSATLAAQLGSRLLPSPDRYAALAGLGAEELLARLPALPHREYSIASLPADGRVELVVRQMRRDDGRLGHGSGWLTAHAPLHATIALRVRSNRNFHLPDSERPLLLIGNGTGIAGLRAHLKARVAAGRARNWLLFGERRRQDDFFFRDEIEAWQRAGLLAHVDLAFSRDQAGRVYVQQRLREQQARLRTWLDDGATVLVCGSLDGMAPAVDAVLRETLGAAGYDDFVESGRYRRDVY